MIRGGFFPLFFYIFTLARSNRIPKSGGFLLFHLSTWLELSEANAEECAGDRVATVAGGIRWKRLLFLEIDQGP